MPMLCREAASVLTTEDVKIAVDKFEAQLLAQGVAAETAAFGGLLVAHSGDFILQNSPAELVAQLDGILKSEEETAELNAVAERVLGVRQAAHLLEGGHRQRNWREDHNVEEQDTKGIVELVGMAKLQKYFDLYGEQLRNVSL